MMQRFNEEQMTSDPPPPKPVITSTELDEEQGAPKPEARHSSWFDRNRVTRVPLIALENDLYKVDNQAYACFSMIRPEEYGKLRHGEKEYHGYLIKFRGCFPSKELAVAHIEKLMKVDRHFDIHLIPCFQWSSIDDDAVEDREYANEMISDIMKGYFKQENDRMIGIRERIRRTEENKQVRSDESASFFDESQNMKNMTLEDKKVEVQAVSLDDLAADLEVNVGASILTHDHKLEDEETNAIVSEILLE